MVDANKAFRFGFHHVRLEQGLANGSKLKAGQKLGTIGNEQNHGEIAVEVMTSQGRSLMSFFEVASDEVLKAYAARGLTDIKMLSIQKKSVTLNRSSAIKKPWKDALREAVTTERRIQPV